MRTVTICCVLQGLLLCWAAATTWAADPMLAHDVYFTLKDDSGQAKEELVVGCKEFLADHPGVVWFSAGVLVKEHQRDVNDLDFDVALHMVFKDKAAHDKYQEADGHHKFIEEFSENWESVRVFDSFVNVKSHGDAEDGHHGEKAEGEGHHGDADHDHDHAHDDHEHAHGDADPGHDHPDPVAKPRLPDPAAFFAGMVRGKVAAKYDSGDFALAVTQVAKLWQNNKAEKPESLVGKTVLVDGREDGEAVAKFIRSLEVGETITVDVAHRGKGEALTILELTEEQRKRIK